MSFDAPLQLAWATTIFVVVLLYMRWAARKTHPTTTLPIWQHALARRPWWSRWRRTVSILAACVPVVLIAVALAQPFFSTSLTKSRTIVVIIDNTASMNAKLSGTSRLELAKRQARGLIRKLRTHDRMAILSADSTVSVRCGMTDDRTALHLALDNVQPTDGVGAMDACIATARQLVEDDQRAVVVVISDAAFEKREAASGKDIAWIPVGVTTDNLAITRLAARPALAISSEQEVLVEIANFGREVATTQVELQVAQQPPVMLEFSILAGETAQQLTQMTVSQAALLTARLPSDDALSADNAESMFVLPASVVDILLITGEVNSPAEVALRSLPNVQVTTTSSLPSEYSKTSLIVFAGAVPKSIPARPALVLGPTNESELWTVGGVVAKPQAANGATHPLLRNVALRDVIIDEAMKLNFNPEATTLVTAMDGTPLYSLISRTTGDVAVLSFSPRKSDVALHADYSRLIANAVTWLTGSDQVARQQWRTSEKVALTGSEYSRTIVSPYGESHAASANLTEVGIWQVSDGDGKLTAALPVNLEFSAESNLAVDTSQLRTAWPNTSWWPDLGPLWTPLTALALIWIAGHWAFYQRRDID